MDSNNIRDYIVDIKNTTLTQRQTLEQVLLNNKEKISDNSTVLKIKIY
jgi:hypothetical protein